MNRMRQSQTTTRLWALAGFLCATLATIALANGQTVSRGAPPPGNSPGVAPASGENGSAETQLAAAEKDVDCQHLQRIYKAISAYYRDHQDLPNWLSDLVPQYLSDPNDLLSPVETRTGKSVLYGRTDPKLRTSYIYEFNAAPAPEEFNRGRTVPLTCKEWKLMQLGKFGMVTPILRCHLHTPVLNVAYGGELYETGLLWENDPRTVALIKAHPALGPKPSQASGACVNVKVVDAETGDPIGAAAVRSTLGSEFGLLPPGSCVTDTNGTALVPLGEWKVNFLFLTASHPRYQPQQFNWNRDPSKEDTTPAQLTLKMTGL